MTNAALSKFLAREVVFTESQGLVSQNWQRSQGNGTAVMNTGRANACMLPYIGGDIVTNLCVGVGIAGVGTAPTLVRFGLADLTGKILALTADVHATFGTTTGTPEVPLTAPYTVTRNGGLYHVSLMVGAFGTTNLQLIRLIGSGVAITAVGGGAAEIADQNGLTDLPAVGSSLTLSAGTTGSIGYWVGST